RDRQLGQDGRIRVEARQKTRRQKPRVPARRSGRSAGCKRQCRSRAFKSGFASRDQTGAGGPGGPPHFKKERPGSRARLVESSLRKSAGTLCRPLARFQRGAVALTFGKRRLSRDRGKRGFE